MSLSANDIVSHIMEKSIEKAGVNNPGALKRYHVSQTAEQLPDFRVRNAFYRAELERQIQEKREAERRRKEREALEEERLIRKVEEEREKLRREYLDEIEQRRILQEDAFKKQQLIAKKFEEMHEEEERKREDEQTRKRQQALMEKRISDLREAVAKKKAEEASRRRLMMNYYYGHGGGRYSQGQDESRSLVRAADFDAFDYYKRPWNSRDYVHSSLYPDSLILEDVYFEAPLHMLADVYKQLDSEKSRIKDIMRQRIIQGES